MKIRTALTLKYTAVTASVFLVCMLVVYGVSERTRSDTFFRNLRSEAVTKAHLFLDGKVDAATMQSIYRNNSRFIDEVEVAVYTPDFRMLYHDAAENDIIREDRQMIESILRRGELRLRIGRYQAIGLVYRFEGREYVVTAAAYDGFGYANIAQLERTVAMLFILGLSLLSVAGYLLARNALKPVRRIVREAEKITASRIERRLPVKGRDELGELCGAFNALLERLQVSFESQKTFVSNVSHELRTPLAALIAEIDLALQRERTPEEYRQSLHNALQDARRMTRLTEGLLNLARIDYRCEEIAMQPVRLDELLLDVRETLLRAHPDYRIDLVFGQESNDERSITVSGNGYLLGIAFSNLIENNCKCSDNRTSFVQISSWERMAVVRLSDSGTGISEEEMRHLFTPFRRGGTQQRIEGYGIGMALAQKVIRLHGGEIAVHSMKGEGTTYVVELPHV